MRLHILSDSKKQKICINKMWTRSKSNMSGKQEMAISERQN